MKSEKFFQVETEPKETVSLREILSRIKDGTEESLATFFDRNGDEIEERGVNEFERTPSNDLGKLAGEFFSTLVPNGIKGVKIGHRIPDKIEETKGLRRLGIPYDELVGGVEIDSTKLEETGGKVEEKTRAEGLVQSVRYGFFQEGRHNFIREKVVNLISEGSEKNVASSRLVVENADSGLRLDLGRILPNDFSFTPGKMNGIQTEVERGEIVEKSVLVDLKSYDGTRGSGNSFLEAPVEREVYYGDLTKKGGFLKLLHEITHAWQAAHGCDSGNVNFHNFYEAAEGCLVAARRMSHKIEGSDGSLSAEGTTQLADFLATLKKLGIETNEKNIKYVGFELKSGETKLRERTRWGSFIIKSEKLDALVADYEGGERDAWAHAIRVLRFLRKNGMDLEPELKTLEDFKELIDPCLASYQEYVKGFIESSPRGIRFVRGKSKK